MKPNIFENCKVQSCASSAWLTCDLCQEKRKATSHGDKAHNNTRPVVDRAVMVVTAEKIYSCVFSLICACPFFTQPGSAGFLRYCSFSRVHLEVCSPHNHDHWFDPSMTSYHPQVRRTLSPPILSQQPCLSASEVTLCFGFTAIQRH